MKPRKQKDTTPAAAASVRTTVLRLGPQGALRRADRVAREEPLEFRVLGRGVAVTMRTPGHDDELAAGFLLTEGIVGAKGDIVGIAHCGRGADADLGNILNVFLAPSVRVDFERLTRHVFTSSSCGVCGKSSIEAVHQRWDPVLSAVSFRASRIVRMPDALRAAQKTFARTGGLHAAAIFDERGNLLVSREDIGRHNAVDKVVGHGLLHDRLPFDRHILLVSGRASFEIMQKALAARIPVVCAISAPSSLAVEFARESGQTLVGFLRDGAMNIYTHPDRVSEC